MPVEDIPRHLIAWYDDHARDLPWRVPPHAGRRADPYQVWLSEVMLQQTTVAAVIPYFRRFLERWPTVTALAAAEDGALMAAWAGLGYYARARNLLAAARAVAAQGGRFPNDEAGLRALPGIGAYTAAAIAAIAFERPAVVVDGNVERVVARLFAVETPLPDARPILHAHAAAITPAARPGDHAQAMMDLGATICTPRAPACPACPLAADCGALAIDVPARFPIKRAKAIRPERRGTAFWLERAGHVRRPPSGLLGGMLALPTGPWTAADPGLADAPAEVAWQPAGRVRHIFTHFVLDLAVVTGQGGGTYPGGQWWPIADLDAAGLPTLFTRAAALARDGQRSLVLG